MLMIEFDGFTAILWLTV